MYLHNAHIYPGTILEYKTCFNYLMLRYANYQNKTSRLAILLNLSWRKFKHGMLRKEDNKYADQTARMRRLVCAFVVRMQQHKVFSQKCKAMNSTYLKCQLVKLKTTVWKQSYWSQSSFWNRYWVFQWYDHVMSKPGYSICERKGRKLIGRIFSQSI